MRIGWLSVATLSVMAAMSQTALTAEKPAIGEAIIPPASVQPSPPAAPAPLASEAPTPVVHPPAAEAIAPPAAPASRHFAQNRRFGRRGPLTAHYVGRYGGVSGGYDPGGGASFGLGGPGGGHRRIAPGRYWR